MTIIPPVDRLHTNPYGRPRTFHWKHATDQARCIMFRRLDTQFATDPASPLHHDHRCPLHHREVA